MMEAEDEKRGDGTSIAGTLVRLAWHASGTYSKVILSAFRAVPGFLGCRRRKQASRSNESHTSKI